MIGRCEPSGNADRCLRLSGSLQKFVALLTHGQVARFLVQAICLPRQSFLECEGLFNPTTLLHRTIPNGTKSESSTPVPGTSSQGSGGWVLLQWRGAVMPINRLFREGKIKPEKVERLNRALTFALSALSLVDRNDPILRSSRAKSLR